MAKIKPLGDRYLIEPIREEKKKGGIILPETISKDKPEEGKIVAVGTGKLSHEGKMVPLELKKGAKVLFTKYAPHEIKVGEKKYLVVKEEDILAVID
jgi:chaperonin GroES